MTSYSDGELTLVAASATDPGRDPTKRTNEDYSGFAETPHGFLAVVCDGMGGHAGGERASQMAVSTLTAFVKSAPDDVGAGRALKAGLETAARAVYAIGGDHPADLRPGSTCVALLFTRNGVEIAHVGDSRAYLWRNGQLHRLTSDHSLVQELVDAGIVPAEQAAHHPEANKITRALGIAPDVQVELRARPLPIAQGDLFLLCTDGLTDMLSDAELATVFGARAAADVQALCRELVERANEHGGHDNVTAQVVHAASAPALRGPAPTLVEGAEPATQTMVMEESPKTEPGTRPVSPTIVGDDPGRTAPRPRFSDDEPPPPRRASRAFATSALATAAILVAILAWWLISFLRDHPDEAPAPIDSSVTSATPPPLELEASVGSEPESPTPSVDAGRPPPSPAPANSAEKTQ